MRVRDPISKFLTAWKLILDSWSVHKQRGETLVFSTLLAGYQTIQTTGEKTIREQKKKC